MFILFLLYQLACRIFGPQAGIRPMPPAWETWSLNHCTTRDILEPLILHVLNEC